MSTTKTEFTSAKLANMDRATADPRLSHLDCRMLWRMLSAADGQTGIIRRTQADLAEALRITRRAVQRCRDRLVEFDYLEAIGKRPGGYVNGYKMVMRERRPCGRLAAADHEKATLQSPIGDPAVAQRRPGIRTNTSLSSPTSILPSDHRDTEPAGLAAPVKALGPPFGDFDADLRQRLGEGSKWLAMCRLAERSGDTVTLSALTTHQADTIRQHCEAEILAASGATRLAFQVAINTAELPKLRSCAP